MTRSLPLVLMALLAWPALAQVAISGRVHDAVSGEPLAFVHVVVDGEREGTTTDIDGRFVLHVATLPAHLRFSYVGHAPMHLRVDTAGVPLAVGMQRTAVDLAAVEVRPGENPAHRIIERVRANRRQNDALRNRPHRYTSYSKTVFTAAVDSAVRHDPERYAELDTGEQQAIEWLERQHLLLIESATKRTFIPPAAEKEEVLAMRVSGLQDPSLLAMAASTKTFSMYEPQVDLGGERTYLSPLGPNGTDRYLFLLEDTMYQGPDTVFIISYRPRTGRKFDGLKGQLHVHTDGYALQHVIAEPADDHSAGMSAKLQQRFVRVPTGPHGTGPHAWFPDQLNTFLFFNFARVGSMKVIGVGRTYLQGIEVDVDVERREVRGAEFVMETLATRRDDDFWNSLRTDSLDDRELRTYHVIDSLSRAQGLERRLRWLGHLLSGRAPVGPVDVLLDHVLRYNAHEGLRPGLGLATNDRVWRFASVGGHFAYGLRDTEWKYGGELTIKPWAGRGPQLRLYHLNDVEESGGAAFRGTPRTLDSEAYRLLYMDRMHRQERTGAELAFRVGGPLRVWLGTARTDRRDLLGYRHAVPLPADRTGDAEGVTLLHDAFLTGEVSIGLRYAFREQVAQLPRQQFGLGTRWPVLYVHVARAVPGLWGGDLDLWRADAMVEKTFHLRMLGDLSFRLQGGMAPADAPYPFLYNMRGTFGNGLLVAARNSFETMRPNEFTAHRYVALHLRHGFGGLLWKRGRSSPVLVLVANAGIGAPVRAELHRGHAVQGMEHGFAEAGLQIDRLLRIGFSRLGVGAFHRFGAYRFPDALDNIAVKLTLGIGL